MQRLKKVDGVCRLVARLILIVFFCGAVLGQCAADVSGAQPDASQIQQFQIQQNFEKQDWAEVVRLAETMAARSADVNFEYGLALAHLQQLPKARAALMAGARACPQQKRFDLELAGVAFEEKRYPEASAWLRRGLKLDPRDAYANDFAGTVFLLMGNMNAALKYWNRVQKPYVAAMDFDPQLKVQRLILDRAFAFSPEAELKEREFETTEARLDGLGIFSRYNIVLNARADGKFGAEFHAQERNGFGSGWAGALVSTFGGAVYGDDLSELLQHWWVGCEFRIAFAVGCAEAAGVGFDFRAAERSAGVSLAAECRCAERELGDTAIVYWARLQCWGR